MTDPHAVHTPGPVKRTGTLTALADTHRELVAAMRATYANRTRNRWGIFALAGIFLFQYPPVMVRRYFLAGIVMPLRRIRIRSLHRVFMIWPHLRKHVSRYLPKDTLSPIDRALTRAVLRREPYNVEIFLKRGANPSLRFKRMYSLIVIPVGRGDIEIVRLLLEAGASSDTRDFGTNLPLIVKAAVKNDVEMARLLLEHGADADGHGPNGMTALHFAAAKEHVEMVRLLLSYGADPQKRDYTGACALSCAAAKNNQEILQMIADRRPMPGRRSAPQRE